MSKSQWLQRSVAVIVMSGQLSSCTGWRAESLSPVDVIEDQHPGEIRVQRGDGRSEVLYRPEEDRKSTRLNSSHANISYAVFCLKKKKKKKKTQNLYKHRK